MLPTDALFWYAEEASPGMRSTIAGLFILPLNPDFDRVRDCVKRAMESLPRLRQRAVEAPLNLLLPEWVDDPHMDLEYHLRREAVASPGSEDALLSQAAALIASPLDRARPLWEIHVLEGLSTGGCAVLVKVHQALVEGVGGMAALKAFTEAGPAGCQKRRTRSRKRARRTLSPRMVLLRDAVTGVASLARDALSLAEEASVHPVETVQRAAAVTRGAAGMIRDLRTAPIEDPIAVDATGMSRRLGQWSVPMTGLRRASRSLEATINDVILTVVSGGVGRYHAFRGARMEALRAMVPMDLHPEEDAHVLGHHFGMMNIELPVGEPDPARRLDIIRARTRVAKGDRRTALYPFLTRALAVLPGVALKKFMENSAARVNLICMNIPGIETPRWFAGRLIDRMIPFAPVVEGCPLSIALLSYRHDVEIGIATDPEAIPDPEKLRSHLRDAYTEVLALAETKPPPPARLPSRRHRAPAHA
jgi:diacylglycerol O-acyltransferase